MKRISSTLLLCIILSFSSYAQEEMKLNLKKSAVHWLGSKMFGFYNHYGIVLFSEGKLHITDKKISGGEFIVDMNTITNTDGEYSESLIDHLKNEDFFDVPNYPTARLFITKVDYEDGENANMTADLTIKGITLPVEFTAQLDYDLQQMVANFSIDRTRWNIVFESQSVTNIKDHIISDEIEFKVQLSFQ
ncbi:MAG: YceI family protein [Bacteroidota bacterium]